MSTRIYILCDSGNRPRGSTTDPETALRLLSRGEANGMSDMILEVLEVWEGGYSVCVHYHAEVGLTLEDL